MANHDISKLIRHHNGFEGFNYDLVVDWAVGLIENGMDSENILILASFAKPVDSDEMKPYLSAVLKDLNLEEKRGNEAVFGLIEFYLTEILNGHSIRDKLLFFYHMYLEKDCVSNNDQFDITPFYLLFHAWCDLEEVGMNFYFENTDLNNIEDVCKNEARRWLMKHDTLSN